MVPFVSQQLQNLDLALALARRGNLPGAEQLVVANFERQFAAGQFKEAAEAAADSPQVRWMLWECEQGVWGAVVSRVRLAGSGVAAGHRSARLPSRCRWIFQRLAVACAGQAVQLLAARPAMLSLITLLRRRCRACCARSKPSSASSVCPPSRARPRRCSSTLVSFLRQEGWSDRHCCLPGYCRSAFA